MSKRSPKKSIILLFILVGGLIPLPVFAIINKQQSLISQQGQNSLIPVALPSLAIVTLKGGKKKSGRLIDSNWRSQEIKLYNNGEVIIKTPEIKEIIFEGEVILKSGGKIVVRGEENQNTPSNSQDKWTESLNNFRVTNSKKGAAEVNLTSVKPGELAEISADAKEKDTTYIIKKMQFDKSGKVTINLEIHRN